MIFGILKKKKSVSKKRKTKKRSRKKKKAFGGYQIIPDEKLSAIIGKKPVTPSQMTKKIWQYIKRKKLAKK